MKLKAKHILLSHADAEMSTHERPLGVAMKDAEALIKEIESGKITWDKAAYDNSACPSGKRSCGDLGWFEEEQMVPEFSNAVKVLHIDQVGPPVITPFGVHIIMRTG
jgi:parvulin-like peptidyl-prolyl isomerase